VYKTAKQLAPLGRQWTKKTSFESFPENSRSSLPLRDRPVPSHRKCTMTDSGKPSDHYSCKDDDLNISHSLLLTIRVCTAYRY